MSNQPIPPVDARGFRDVSIEALVEDAVERAISRMLSPYLVRLQKPAPLVYTAAQAGDVLQLSPDSVTRLVKRGILTRVPHIDGKLLIPCSSVRELVEASLESTRSSAPVTKLRPSDSNRSRPAQQTRSSKDTA